VIDRRILLLLGGCTVFAALIGFELRGGGTADAVTEKRPIPTPAASLVRQVRPVSPESLLAVVLARPLFSSTRRPPQSSGPSAFAITNKRLAGIVIEPDRRLAIFAVTGTRPLVLTEGETVDGWKVENITPLEVSLRGPGGTQTLRPKLDPSLAPPARPNAPIAQGGRPAAQVGPTLRGRPEARGVASGQANARRAVLARRPASIGRHQ